MNYQKKYSQKKEQIINELKSAFNNNLDLLNRTDFSIYSISFQNGRNEDDFIEVILLNNEEKLTLKIIFWITFCLDFEFQDSRATIIYNLYKQKTDNDFLCVFNHNVKYDELKGISLEDKTKNLISKVIEDFKS